MKNLTTNELFGRIFFRCSDLRPIDGYFSCLNSVKSLLESPNFKSSTSGFYINVSEGVNSVRLSYFTSNRAETEGAIQGFSDENSNIRIFKREEPHVAEVSRGYGDEELRFRKFLHTYTQIRFIGLHKSHFLAASIIFTDLVFARDFSELIQEIRHKRLNESDFVSLSTSIGG